MHENQLSSNLDDASDISEKLTDKDIIDVINIFEQEI